MWVIEKSILFSTLLCLSLSAYGHGFTSANHPQLMSVAGKFQNAPLSMNLNYATLPTSAFLEGSKTPWSDTYWPTYEGGISYRYKKGDVIAAFLRRTFKLYQHNKKALKQMSEEKIAKLSPAEKFDIYNCDYNYSLTQSEIERTKDVVAHPNNQRWFGLCHGWAPAAIQYEEPNCVTLENADGIKIKFGSSDIKALLTYFEGEVDDSPSCMAGLRCNISKTDLAKNPALKKDPSFEDINPGSFHVIITNLLTNGQGFVMDRAADAEVWNQPIYGFESRKLSESSTVASEAAPGTVKEVRVESTVHWIAELRPSDQPFRGDAGAEQVMRKQSVYSYILELDKNDNILGGRWIGQSVDDHPDFVWMKGNKAFNQFKGWSKLNEIYQAAIKR